MNELQDQTVRMVEARRAEIAEEIGTDEWSYEEPDWTGEPGQWGRVCLLDGPDGPMIALAWLDSRHADARLQIAPAL